MPSHAAANSAFTRYQAGLGATAILIAAELHRRKTKSWPASIAAIDPTILPKVPLDPYTNEPILIERRDGKIMIHSIGPDLKDDHGAYDLKKWQRGGPDDVGSVAWDVVLRGQANRTK